MSKWPTPNRRSEFPHTFCLGHAITSDTRKRDTSKVHHRNLRISENKNSLSSDVV